MKTILLIEDNAEMRENTAEILELAKYRVITANDGREGVRLAQSENPDLIISDIMMPELDGFGVLHMLGKDAATAGIPFVFLTARAERSDLRRAMSMGADDYLTKPFENSELLSVVETRLKKNELLKKEFKRNSEGLEQFIDEVKKVDPLQTLSQNRESRHFPKKSKLYTEGAIPRGVFLINQGKVKITKSNELGKEYITTLHGEGDFIGYTTLLEGKAYTESAVAIEDTDAVYIPKEDFFALLFNNRDVAGKFIKLLSWNVLEMENRLLHLAYNSVRKRVAEALLMIQERFSANEKLDMAIAREDLASLVGTATETVVRTLSDFKEEGLINIKGSNIIILDEEKLRRMRN